ncbi:MAG: hypothetical protein AAFO63_13995, partial [Pseudomonadota bacterium]
FKCSWNEQSLEGHNNIHGRSYGSTFNQGSYSVLILVNPHRVLIGVVSSEIELVGLDRVLFPSLSVF